MYKKITGVDEASCR
jgi:hypothetical protein